MTPDWLRVDLALVQRVGAEAALVHSLIEYRGHGSQGWEATREDMASALHLTEHRVRGALTALRDAGLVTSSRADRFRPTLTWTAVCPGATEKLESTVTRRRDSTAPERVKSAVTSLEEVEEVLVEVPTEPQTATRSPRRKPKRPYPEDFRPSESHLKKARELGVDLSIEGPKFQHYHQAKDSRFADWGAALHLWITNAARFAQERAERDNVHQLRPGQPPVGEVFSTQNSYDPSYAATLPPPRTDPFAVSW